jgi:hypothetical protein
VIVQTLFQCPKTAFQTLVVFGIFNSLNSSKTNKYGKLFLMLRHALRSFLCVKYVLPVTLFRLRSFKNHSTLPAIVQNQ